MNRGLSEAQNSIKEEKRRITCDYDYSRSQYCDMYKITISTTYQLNNSSIRTYRVFRKIYYKLLELVEETDNE